MYLMLLVSKSLIYPYKVFLEYSTDTFFSDCVPLIQRIKTEKKYSFNYKRRKIHSTKRKGRIDIAVYKDGGGLHENMIPFCAIEVKGYNPNKYEIKKTL